jgi:predicted membrane metal-binding protein
MRQGGSLPWRVSFTLDGSSRQMPLLILGLVGFVLFALLSVLWVAFWVVTALFWLALPVALLVFGASIWRAQARRWYALPADAQGRPSPFVRKSGNTAFDDYKAETLRRLDEERERFRDFLERRRQSRDKEAFDRFVSERRGGRNVEDLREVTT